MNQIRELMNKAVGSEVEIHIVGSVKPCIGRCIGYTQPIDNEPEVATIDIKMPGLPSIYEITENEIESIVIK